MLETLAEMGRKEDNSFFESLETELDRYGDGSESEYMKTLLDSVREKEEERIEHVRGIIAWYRRQCNHDGPRMLEM